MPIFEYQCKECDSVFEIFLKSRREEKDVKCINCGGGKVGKLFSSFYSSLKSSADRCETCPVKNCPQKHNL